MDARRDQLPSRKKPIIFERRNLSFQSSEEKAEKAPRKEWKKESHRKPPSHSAQMNVKEQMPRTEKRSPKAPPKPGEIYTDNGRKVLCMKGDGLCFFRAVMCSKMGRSDFATCTAAQLEKCFFTILMGNLSWQ